ncbi:tripartite tricarboxylate transporter substrate binding protein [Caldimonas caldifontis]|jgi:tripartite-type tricarboxylate transporter receptor subunit TctC|uniref:MFS transporter n=1 Tax=Caldimonas caldifontis TaxID=1452508 RepID=A0A2S5SU24_9BURK|nr:tripartite tricarboxylate transporter substrate binding protein [Caldimonas caldifontis]PPE66225.1 MFS transporter [Caldimonas caldifontis]
MKPSLSKRPTLKLLAGAALLAVSGGLFAQANYPTKPVRVVVGFAAGGTTDVIARLVAQKLSESMGQQFIIENRAGAGSNLGAQAVARADADGYTLYASSVANTINMSLFAKPGYDFANGMDAVALFAKVPNLLVVHPSVPVKNVQEYIAYAKANPGKVTFASSGNGSSIHLSGELFKQMTGVDMTHVPYRGSAPAISDLIGGQVQSMFDNMPSALPHVQGGKLRALAVTSAQRSAAAPDVPTLAEAGVPGYDVQSWFGLNAPKGTPKAIVDKLNAEVNKALALPDVQKRLAELGAVASPMSPAAYDKFIKAEVAKWAPVVKASGATVD